MNDFYEDRACDYGIRKHRGNSRPNCAQRGDKIEDLPHHQRMGHFVDEHESPNGWKYHPGLKGIIRKGVGKPWGKVYAELLEFVKSNYSPSVWKDVLDTIEWNVETNPMDVGDGDYVQSNGHPFYSYGKREDYVVHPVTGMLMKVPEKWTKVRFDSRDGERWYVTKDSVHYWQNRYFRQISGIWYEVELVRVPKEPRTSNHTCCGWRPRDEDWLYKMNLRDVVFRTRIYSDLVGSLASAHGYLTRQNRFVSREQYQKESAERIRRSYFLSHKDFLPADEGFPVYAKSMWQVKKSVLTQAGILGANLTAPNIVR